jgi:hypothetical protein
LARIFPNATCGCWDRTIYQLTFCEEFDDLLKSESEEYLEYMETGGPDESYLFGVYQEKSLLDKCP